MAIEDGLFVGTKGVGERSGGEAMEWRGVNELMSGRVFEWLRGDYIVVNQSSESRGELKLIE